MLINSISPQASNFNGSWQKAVFNGQDLYEAVKIFSSIQHIARAASKKQKVYIRDIGSKDGLDVLQLGGLGFISVISGRNFEYRVTGKKFPKVLLKGLEKCFNAKTSEEAREIANKARTDYALQAIKTPMQKMKKAFSRDDVKTFISNLKVFFKPGEKCNPDGILDAVGKVMQADSVNEAKRIAIAVTGKPVQLQ